MSRAKWMLVISATTLTSCNGDDAKVDAGMPAAGLDGDRADERSAMEASAPETASLDATADSSAADSSAATSDASEENPLEASSPMSNDAIADAVGESLDSGSVSDAATIDIVQPDVDIDACGPCPEGWTLAYVLPFVDAQSSATDQRRARLRGDMGALRRRPSVDGCRSRRRRPMPIGVHSHQRRLHEPLQYFFARLRRPRLRERLGNLSQPSSLRD